MVLRRQPREVKAGCGSRRGALRVLATNVHHDLSNVARFAQLLRRENPDVVVVQEVSPNWFEAAEPHLREYPYRVGEMMARVLRSALLSRHPLEDERLHWIVPETYAVVQAVVRAPEGRVTVVDFHAVPPTCREWALRRNATFRARAGALAKLEGPPLVVGDHNASPWSGSHRGMVRKAGLRSARRGFGILPTWPSWAGPLGAPLDQCLHRGGCRIADCRTGRNRGSDHLPLIVDVVLPDASPLRAALSALGCCG